MMVGQRRRTVYVEDVVRGVMARAEGGMVGVMDVCHRKVVDPRKAD